jgi:chromosome segregation ATPase
VVANLKTELDAANQARTQLQGSLEEANSEIEKRQSEIERLTAELEKATDLAKDAEAPDQEGDSASEPSDAWQPHEGRLRNKGRAARLGTRLASGACRAALRQLPH